jgi:hypothetical protein
MAVRFQNLSIEDWAREARFTVERMRFHTPSTTPFNGTAVFGTLNHYARLANAAKATGDMLTYRRLRAAVADLRSALATSRRQQHQLASPEEA